MTDRRRPWRPGWRHRLFHFAPPWAVYHHWWFYETIAEFYEDHPLVRFHREVNRTLGGGVTPAEGITVDPKVWRREGLRGKGRTRNLLKNPRRKASKRLGGPL